MIISIALVRRRHGLSWPEFSRHWSGRHAPIARRIPQLARYTQCHAHPEDQIADAGYDGCAIAGFPDLASLTRMRDDPVYLDEAVPDEARFVDRSAMRAVLMTRRTAEGECDREGGGKLMVFVRQIPELDAGQMGEALRDVLATSKTWSGLPRGYAYSHAIDVDPRLTPPGAGRREFDGLAELWFAERGDTRPARSAWPTPADPITAALYDSVRLVVRENHVIENRPEPATR